MEKQRFSKKIINICIISVIIVAIIFIALMFILNYDVNGETNMPFQVSKISVISSTDGKDNPESEYKWNINCIQNNDIFIYVEKNEDYKGQTSIKSIKLDNFYVAEKPNIGEIKFYRPIEKENVLFENVEENEIKELEFIGGKSSNVGNLEISNQGGILKFRCANNNVGNYLSNDDEQINYNELLKKINVNEDDLKGRITFDITINLHSGKTFKAESVSIEIPNENTVNDGTVGDENIYLKEVVFKRIEN